MLGKLLKHEFKVTSRYFIPMYIAIGVTTILLKLSFLFSENSIFMTMGTSTFMDIVQGLLITAYVIVLVGTMIMSAYLLIRRFYTNMFGDEGYLTHTLPVTGGQLLNSKLICSFVWTLLAGPINLLSFILLFAGTDMFYTISYYISQVMDQIHILNLSGFSVGLMRTELFLLFLTSILTSLLTFYLSITLGHHFMSEHRLAGTILFYFILNMISSVFNTVFTTVLETALYDSFMTPNISDVFSVLTLVFGIALVVNLVMIVIYYLVTKHLLTKKLNLS